MAGADKDKIVAFLFDFFPVDFSLELRDIDSAADSIIFVTFVLKDAVIVIFEIFPVVIMKPCGQGEGAEMVFLPGLDIFFLCLCERIVFFFLILFIRFGFFFPVGSLVCFGFFLVSGSLVRFGLFFVTGSLVRSGFVLFSGGLVRFGFFLVSGSLVRFGFFLVSGSLVRFSYFFVVGSLVCRLLFGGIAAGSGC